MTDRPTTPRDFRNAIEDALSVIRRADRTIPAASSRPGRRGLPSMPLSSLLDACTDRLAVAEARVEEPVRSLNHLACTGGTLISRCISAMPNTRLLSEVDPLSPLARRLGFSPTDMVRLATHGSRPASDRALTDIFLAGLDALLADSVAGGLRLVLRDHAHSHFSYGPEVPDRPTLRQLLRPRYRLLSVVTVRHPIDSFLSLTHNGWEHFRPFTLQEYCRRYDAFLDAYADVPLVRYEDFVATPEAVLERICGLLDLKYSDTFRTTFPAISLTGDSGRKGDTIALRPRRTLPKQVSEQLPESPAYAALCQRLGYEAAV